MQFRPSKKQYEAWQRLHDNHTEFIGYGGSAFSGKSYLICYWITVNALRYPDTAWGLGRRELVNLKRTTLMTLYKVFNEVGLTEDSYSNNGQLNVITLFNKSQIFLIDTAYRPSDPLYTRFGGFELTSCAIDESNETDYKAIEILATRIGRRNNDRYDIHPKLAETFNPDKGHIYRRYYLPHKNGSIQPNIAFIKALPTDNPSPEVDAYVDRIRRNADPVTIERLVNGNFEYDDDPRTLMDYNSITDLFANEHVQEGTGYISCDVARFGSDKSVVMVWKGWKVVEVKSYAQNSLTELSENIRQLATKYAIPRSRIVADEDGVGGGVVDMLKCKGFKNASRPMNQKAHEDFANLRSQCWFNIAQKVNASEIWVQDSSVQDSLTKELEQIKQKTIEGDKKRAIMSKDDIKNSLGRSPDYADAMMMRYYFELSGGGKIKMR